MRYPIVLAHGIARFDILIRPDNNPELDSLHYWKNIRSLLNAAGHEVRHTSVDWAGSVETRAGQLTKQVLAFLEQQPEDRRKVHIIAHSMGGLDSRHAIVRNGLGPHVASLTTIGTPHHGTSFADWGVQSGLVERVRFVVRLLGIDISGLNDLTTWACARRNQEFHDFEERNEHGILYQSYAGVQNLNNIFHLLQLPHRLILKKEGPNDGLVPESSARWKDSAYQATLDLDHLNQLGWWDLAEWEIFGGRRTPESFEQEIAELYLSILRRLETQQH